MSRFENQPSYIDRGKLLAAAGTFAIPFLPTLRACVEEFHKKSEPLSIDPQRLSIPKIGINKEPILKTVYDPTTKALHVPDHGIATPSPDLKDSLRIPQSTIYTYGHSSWNSIKSPLAQLPRLEIGDPIEINGISRELETSFAFQVSDFWLMYRSPTQEQLILDYLNALQTHTPYFVLFTSARVNTEKDKPEPWLLEVDEETVRAKSRPYTDRTNINDYLLFFVTGTPR